MQNRAKFLGIPVGIFIKTYSREFPNGNSWWPWVSLGWVEEQAILQEQSTNVVHTAGNRMQCRV